MSVSSFQAFSDKGTSITFDLEDDSYGYEVREIEGLDPVKATLVFSSFAQRDNDVYQSSRRGKRYIQFKLGYGYGGLGGTVKQLRDNLYKYFMPKSLVKLRFLQDDGPTVDISGIVESFDSPLFVEDPEGTIVVACGDSDFVVLAETVENGFTTGNLIDPTLAVDYPGSIETGYILSSTMNRNVNDVILYHTYPNGTVRTLTLTGLGLINGDILRINTIPGQKAVERIRGGVVSSVLQNFDTTSYWPQLFEGVNSIRLYTPGAAIPFELRYLTRFGGL